VSPSTEKPFGRVVVPSFRDLDRGVAAARAAFDTGPWPHLSIDERAGYLRDAVKIFEDKYLQTAIALQNDETGSPQAFLRSATGVLSSVLEQVVRDAADVTFSETRSGLAGPVRVLREPLGVVVAIVPWKAPVLAAATELFPALLMGCPVLLKTAPQTPFSAYLLAQALSDAGLPPGVVSILPGGRDVGAYLISHPQVDAVTFTGSTATGRQIAAVCGDQLKSVRCELGGKSAVIVAPGADLDAHLSALLAHALTNNGQLHVATTTRLLVHTSQADLVGEALIAAVSTMKIGDPHDRPLHWARWSANCSATGSRATSPPAWRRAPRWPTAEPVRRIRQSVTTCGRRYSPTSPTTWRSPATRSSAPCWPKTPATVSAAGCTPTIPSRLCTWQLSCIAAPAASTMPPLPGAADRSEGTRQAIWAATPAPKGCTGTFR
jgi:hypothetical protein